MHRVMVSYYSGRVKKARASACCDRFTYLNVKPAVGFTLPSAGVAPAPSVHTIAKSRGRYFALGRGKAKICAQSDLGGGEKSVAWVQRVRCNVSEGSHAGMRAARPF
jgi:hypothetical protein